MGCSLWIFGTQSARLTFSRSPWPLICWGIIVWICPLAPGTSADVLIRDGCGPSHTRGDFFDFEVVGEEVDICALCCQKHTTVECGECHLNYCAECIDPHTCGDKIEQSFLFNLSEQIWWNKVVKAIRMCFSCSMLCTDGLLLHLVGKRQLLVYSGASYGNGRLGDSMWESHHKSSAQGKHSPKMQEVPSICPKEARTVTAYTMPTQKFLPKEI